ncbi:MAG: RnfABCDGE type electron transport complex subunit G [Bacteroidales bacterium]|jgi:electron transport complex protein RnfG|nr:RnfABCDGE type electron transport complex subunit G [Bacteroidales bacterium]MBR0322804.1 RnfABCDGE type electron transport complex subunit G [Bacteroidales bacterium]MBR5811216.1 RnfABCDGE type electron transport complex subunit G [Bacteroidales bacterium]
MAVKSSFINMTVCLLAICLVCSGLLAAVYALTAEPIAAAAAAKNEAAIKEVLPETAVKIEEERTVEFEGASYAYNLAYDELGNVVGCAINVAPVGFGGPIAIKVGFDVNGVIWNTKVLSQAETPGLGAKCVEPAFSDQFKGFDASAKKLAVKKDGGDVDAITASTITSRAYADGLALAVKVFDAIGRTPMLLMEDDVISSEQSESGNL